MAEARNRIGEALGQSRPAETAPREVARALFHEHLDLAAIRKALGQPSPANLPRPRPPVVPKAEAPADPGRAAPPPSPAQAALDERVSALLAAREEEIAAWEQPDADLRPPPQRIVTVIEMPPFRPRARRGRWGFLTGVAVVAGMLSTCAWLGFGPDVGDQAARDPVAEAASEAASGNAASAPPAVAVAPVTPQPSGPRAEVTAGAVAPGRPSIGVSRIEAGQPGLVEVQPAFLPTVPDGLAADVPPVEIAVSPAPPSPVTAAASVGVASLPEVALLTPVVAQSPARLSPPEAAAPVLRFAALRPLAPQAPGVRRETVSAPAIRPPDVALDTIGSLAVQSSEPPVPRPDMRMATARPAVEDRPRPAPPAGSSRVVVHHAGNVPQAALTAALRRAGFARVEWRAVPRTTSRTQVRFFHAGDIGLSNRAAVALGQTGYGARQEDFTHFQPPTTPGTVEIWIGG